MPATTQAETLSGAARSFIDQGPQKLLIGGERTGAAGGETFETIDPATGDQICEVALGGPDDVDRAVQAARAALPEYAKVNPAKRQGLIWKLSELIKENSEQLAELES